MKYLTLGMVSNRHVDVVPKIWKASTLIKLIK